MSARILLVDDEPHLLQALKVRLTATGFVCEAATDGQEALERIEQARPDLIVADLVMPGVDGYELCRRLQQHERTASIPVIVLTAVPKDALDPRLASLRIARLMHKPFDSTELLTAVQELLATTKIEGGPRDG